MSCFAHCVPHTPSPLISFLMDLCHQLLSLNFAYWSLKARFTLSPTHSSNSPNSFIHPENPRLGPILMDSKIFRVLLLCGSSKSSPTFYLNISALQKIVLPVSWKIESIAKSSQICLSARPSIHFSELYKLML